MRLCEDCGWVCENHPHKPWARLQLRGALVPRARGAIRIMPSTRHGCRVGSTRRANVISDRGWPREFDDPIVLPSGRVLMTLMDAGDYIAKLPKAEHTAKEWRAKISPS
jgi:hypothetical protein